jgi:hypothetical protein
MSDAIGAAVVTYVAIICVALVGLYLFMMSLHDRLKRLEALEKRRSLENLDG